MSVAWLRGGLSMRRMLSMPQEPQSPAQPSAQAGPRQGQHGGRRGRVSGQQQKRQLMTSLWEGGWLLSPFLVWAVLVISVYTASCVSLSTYTASLNPMQVAGCAVWRMSRMVYYAQELCVHGNVTQPLETYRSLLRTSLDSAVQQYQVLLYGSGTPLVQPSSFSGSDMADVEGAVQQRQLQDLLLGGYGCMRYGDADQPPCPAPGSVYFQQSQRGLVAAGDAVFQAAALLADAAAADLELDSPQLGLVWQVGLYDLHDGLLRVRSFYLSRLGSQYNYLLIMHVVLFVLSCLITLVFIVYLAHPFVRAVRNESRDVAEVLSELPAEVDAEKALAKALTARTGGGGGGSSGGERR